MTDTRRWLNSILRFDQQAVRLPWARHEQRHVWKEKVKARLRAD